MFLLGNADFLEESEDLDVPIGSNIRKCGCIEILNDLLLEDSEVFEITATVNDPRLIITGETVATIATMNDPRLIITGETVATVVINDDNDSKLCTNLVLAVTLLSTKSLGDFYAV